MFTLRWLESPALRKLITAELNKGEALNTLRRAGALHRLGRVLDALRCGSRRINPAHVSHFSPLGWDHINLTERDPDGFPPLRLDAAPAYRESVPQ